MKLQTLLSIGLLAGLGIGSTASAITVTTFYGDDDGFGVGETAGTITNETISHIGVGEAPLTDQRLIGDGFVGLGFPAFAPSGGFDPFLIPAGYEITSASLTLRTGSFDSAPALDAPNRILLDGMTVPSAFIDGFSSANSQVIETLSVSLAPSFFVDLADGAVSLNGTHISEASGSGSFQIDFMRLDMEVERAVPEPITATLGALSLGALTLASGRRRR